MLLDCYCHPALVAPKNLNILKDRPLHQCSLFGLPKFKHINLSLLRA